MYGMPIGDFSTFCGGFGAGQMQSFGPMINPMPNSVFNNCQLNGGKEGAAFSGMAYVAKMQLSSDLSPNGLLGRLGSMETSLGYMKSNLEELLKCDSIDDKQKEAIRTELAKVEENLAKVRTKKAEFQSKFGQLIGNPNLKEVLEGMSYEELSALQQQINDIGVFDTQKEFDETKMEVQNLSNVIKDSLAQKAQDGQSAGASDGTSAGGSADGTSSGSTTKVGEGDKAVEVDNETGRPTSLGDKPSKRDLSSMFVRFNSGINRKWLGLIPGTNHDKIESVISELNSSNIIEFMNKFKNNEKTKTDSGFTTSYGGEKQEYKVDQGSFIGKLLADASHDEKKAWVPTILEALMERAKALGIDDELADYETDCYDELDAYTISESRVGDNITKIYEAITKKEAANATAATDKAAETKAKAEEAETEAKAKEAEETRQKYAQFRKDALDYWRIEDDPDIVINADNIEYKDGKYRAHVNGKDYYGNSFREVLKAIEDAHDTDSAGNEIKPIKFLLAKVKTE